MNKQAIVFGICGVLLGAFIVWFSSTSVVNNQNLPMMGMMGFRNMMGIQAEKPILSVVDAHFIEQMIPHHEDAITMAKLALEKAKHGEIVSLAQNVIETQSKEIDQMKIWYKEWFGTEVPTGRGVLRQRGMMGGGMHMGMMGDETDLARLKEADDFDMVFIEEMIPHHQMAIMMASMLKQGTQREEMKQLAEDIIRAQSYEIDQMRNWYIEWEY